MTSRRPPPGLDDDPVITEREQRWGPVVLAVLALAAAAIPMLPRCDGGRPPPALEPPADTAPRVVVVPADEEPAPAAPAPASPPKSPADAPRLGRGGEGVSGAPATRK